MINRKILTLSLINILLIFSTVNAISSEDRDVIYLEGRNSYNLTGDLCPANSSELYHHHFVLIDITTPLDLDRLALIRRLILSREYIEEQLIPYDRLTIMVLNDRVSPKLNIASFSKCRFRSGQSSSPHKIDHAHWFYESKTHLNEVHQAFLDEIDLVFDSLIDNPRSSKSMLIEQIYEISRLVDNGFSKRYKSQRLTIVSDMVQNSDRFSMYDKHCNLNGNGKCKKYDSIIRADKSLKRYLPALIPSFSGNIDIDILYLHNNSDPNLDRGIIEFWTSFFSKAGINKIKWQYENDHNF